jgi:putative ABC transport system permease protein
MTPPARTRKWLARVVPAEEREVVVGELDELYRAHAESHGVRAADRWYLRQVIGFTLRARRIRSATRIDGDEEGGMGWTEGLVGDVRWALRGLRKRPGFTLVAIATLALGVGANSAVFTLVNAHFLTPLPYEQPDDLVLIWETQRNGDGVTTVSPGNYFTWREEARSFIDIASFNVDAATLSGDGAAERVNAALVAPHYFQLLGVAPVLGAGFDEASARAADGRVVVLSEGLWRRRYGADPDIVGRDIRVDGRPHTVVGVLPASFRQPEKSITWQGAELWRPEALDEQHDDFDSRYLRTIARLGPGVTIAQARAEMDAMAVRMADTYPEANAGRRIQVWTLADYLMGESRPILFMLLAAGAAVLLIVCANVANLTLARGQERKREFAVRAALGSGRRRLLRQVLVESVVLSLAGGLIGAALVYGGRDVLELAQERFFSTLVPAVVDARVLLGTTILALTAGLLFGLPLALAASSTDLRGALVEGGERAGRASGVAQNLLIVGQVGLASTLLITALLLTRSFGALVNVAPGFDAGGILTFAVSAPSTGYEGRAEVEAYFRDVWGELAAVPGVRAVGMVSDLPFTTENRWTSLEPDGVTVDPTNPPVSDFKVATPEYFEVMGIPVLSGSLADDGWETVEGEIPIAVNERMVEMYWSGEEPLGKGISLPWDPPRRLRVAAVVGNVLDDGFDAMPEPLFYVPWGGMPQRRMSFVLETATSGSEVSAAVRAALGRVDPDIPAADLRMLDEILALTVVRPRAASLIGSIFAMIAMLVAAAGIYGVLSYTVQRRTRELGIRSALGASGRQLVNMVLAHSTRLTGLGLLLGILGALAAGRALSGILFGVGTFDPASLLGATLLLGAVGTLAAWMPARRTVRVDPREALRAE